MGVSAAVKLTFRKLLLVLFILSITHQVDCQCSSTIQRGSRGDCVKVVQRTVGVAVDGIFGRNTEAAVKTFQSRKGLAADGIVGRHTWGAINGGASISHSTGGSSVHSNDCGCGYNYASSDSGGPAPGAKQLAEYMKQKYGGRYEIYSPRNIRGTNKKSLHSEGRAVDWYPGNLEAFNHLIAIACNSGIQEVIYNRKIWTKRGNIQNYGGVHPHTDHIHVGLNKCGAQKFSKA